MWILHPSIKFCETISWDDIKVLFVWFSITISKIQNSVTPERQMCQEPYHDGGCGCGVLSSSPAFPNVRTPGLLTHLRKKNSQRVFKCTKAETYLWLFLFWTKRLLKLVRLLINRYIFIYGLWSPPWPTLMFIFWQVNNNIYVVTLPLKGTGVVMQMLPHQFASAFIMFLLRLFL